MNKLIKFLNKHLNLHPTIIIPYLLLLFAIIGGLIILPSLFVTLSIPYKIFVALIIIIYLYLFLKEVIIKWKKEYIY